MLDDKLEMDALASGRSVDCKGGVIVDGWVLRSGVRGWWMRIGC